VNGEILTLHGIVLNLNGTESVHDTVSGNIKDADQLGDSLAKQIKGKGGDKILKEVLQTVERETKVN